jgi:hypothetical protein
MRAPLLRRFIFLALPLVLAAGHLIPTHAQAPGPRSLPMAVDSLIPTRIESLLATPNVLLATDYYRIDMRFGPSMRVDAMVVEAVGARTRLKGVRVQVRDNENRTRQEGTSYIDLDELTELSRALTPMMERASKWTHDDRQATELTVTTTGGFRIAIRQSARVPRAFLSTGLFDAVVTSIELAELPTVKDAFDQALTILNSK